LVTSLFFTGGCQDALARRVVTPPNLKSQLRGTDSPREILAAQFVSQQFRVNVGPPDASLSVWVCEPFSGDETFELRGWGHGIRAILTRRSSAAPSSAAATASPSAPAIKGTVFVLHGIEDDKEMAPYVLYREMLVQAGYRAIQVDLRGHGRSTGDWITYGVVESQDLKQVLDELERRGLVAGDVGVIGLSYGGAIAIQWAAKDPRVKAVVALEPFCTLEDAALDASNLVLGPARWMYNTNDLRAAVKRAGELAHFDPAQASPLAAISTLERPVLIFHSKTDELVNVRQSQKLHDANPNWVKLVLVDKQSHFWMWLESMEMIQAEARAWMNLYLAHEKPAN
jgi:pimeloyl-ACP methyl ester carboxylesterase